MPKGASGGGQAPRIPLLFIQGFHYLDAPQVQRMGERRTLFYPGRPIRLPILRSMHPLDWLLRVILPALFALVIGAMVVVGVTNEPNSLAVGFAPPQPIVFSHKLHAGDNKIACQYCHAQPTKSRYAGVPSVDVCMNCHRVAKPGTDLIRQLTKFYDEGTALEWKRVHRMPDHVYFDHRPHVNAGIDCAVCHGDLQTVEITAQLKPLRMGDCLACHRDPANYIKNPGLRALLKRPDIVGPEHCAACHR